VYNVLCFAEVIYVIKAGDEKSTKSRDIPKRNVVTLEARKMVAEKDYRTHRALYVLNFEARQRRREALIKPAKPPEPKRG
jgi:hypothetical protein